MFFSSRRKNKAAVNLAFNRDYHNHNMRTLSTIVTAGALAALATGTPLRRQDEEYVGYLMTTFVDPLPQVHWHLSEADDPFNFIALNGGDPVLVSDVGTGGVRDMFLTTNTARSEYFMLATGELGCSMFSVIRG